MTKDSTIWDSWEKIKICWGGCCQNIEIYIMHGIIANIKDKGELVLVMFKSKDEKRLVIMLC